MCAGCGCFADSVSTPVVVLPTVGGAAIDIRGTGLGLSASVVTVTYAGGSDGMSRRSLTLPPGACTLATPGTALRYVAAPLVRTCSQQFSMPCLHRVASRVNTPGRRVTEGVCKPAKHWYSCVDRHATHCDTHIMPHAHVHAHTTHSVVLFLLTGWLAAQ